MSIRVKLPKIYDNFRSEYELPHQCSLDPTENIDWSFRVIAEERIMEIPNVASKIIPGISAIKIPLEPRSKPEVIDVLFEYFQGSEVMENVSIPVKTSGIAYVPLNEPTSGDSVFIRMMLENSSILSEAQEHPIMRKLVGYKNNVFEPETIDAARISRSILTYLATFEEDVTEIKDDLVYVSTIIDAQETKKANVYTRGLMFCHFAYKYGLKPFIAFYDDTCIVGVHVSALDIEESEYSKKPVSIHFRDPESLTTGQADGKYLLFDLSELEDQVKSVDSALSVWKSKDILVACSVQYELDKNETFTVEAKL